MRFADVIGQERLKAELVRLADNGRTPHATLFAEDAGSGALPLTLSFIQYLSCKARSEGDSCGVCPSCSKISKMVHPDLHFAFPVTASSSGASKTVSDNFISVWREKVFQNPYITEQQFNEACGVENKLGRISVAEASSIFKKLTMTSFEGGNKYMVIWLAERMNPETSNKLLKLLEEPPPGTYILLISQSPERVLPTIQSRCRLVRVPPIEKSSLSEYLAERFSFNSDEASLWAGISGGSLSRAVELISESMEYSRNDELVESMINSALSKDLAGVIKVWEEVAQCRREVQLGFCRTLLESIRRTYMLSLDVENIAFIPAKRREMYANWAGRINPQFFQRGADLVNGAMADIERNVNSKYIFADLGNRFFLTL
ncbi:MAG: hypothetical protein BGO30_11055 [Bacteroidetes bacterium 41-46]|jgi:DNA polymerase-3 subunit delta'|nr:MAG: hypothetical protein BGO30_11055 [Bacteroidetes bacterium 41-46]